MKKILFVILCSVVSGQIQCNNIKRSWKQKRSIQVVFGNREIRLFVGPDATVLDVKNILQRRESIAVNNQVFCALTRVINTTIPGAIWTVEQRTIMGNNMRIKQIMQDGSHRFQVFQKPTEG